MKPEIIEKLRQYYDLPTDTTTEDVEKLCDSSFGHAVVRLNIATENLRHQMAAVFTNWTGKL